MTVFNNNNINTYIFYLSSKWCYSSWPLMVFDFVKGVYNLKPLTRNQINIFLMFYDFLFFLNYFAQTSHCNANIATNYFGS